MTLATSIRLNQPPLTLCVSGEKVLHYAGDNIVVDVLVNPLCQTVLKKIRLFLTSVSRHHQLLYSGQVLQGSGSWILQDDVISPATVLGIFKESQVDNAIRQKSGGSLHIHTVAEGDWKQGVLDKQAFVNFLQTQLNPPPGGNVKESNGLEQFVQYLSSLIDVRSSKDLLMASNVVGNIRFNRPTLYIFPGCQGDSALFGISGFNLLVNGGYNRKACFWDFTRHLDRIDAILLTHLGVDNIFGVGSVFERKAMEMVHPEIGYVYCNAPDKLKHSPNGDVHPENGGMHKPSSLVVSLLEQSNILAENMGHVLGQSIQNCTGHVQSQVLQPLNLYHKVGHGTLDMYVLSPLQDSKELKEFLSYWQKNAESVFTKGSIPVSNLASVCALLVWKPASPTEKITRIFFPGNAPQQKIFEGLDKLKSLEIFKYAECTEMTFHQKPAGAGKKPAAGRTGGKPAVGKPGSKPETPRAGTPKLEDKKSAAANKEDKKPPTSQARSQQSSKPAKDAKNKKVGATMKKEDKSPTATSSSTSSTPQITTPTEPTVKPVEQVPTKEPENAQPKAETTEPEKAAPAVEPAADAAPPTSQLIDLDEQPKMDDPVAALPEPIMPQDQPAVASSPEIDSEVTKLDPVVADPVPEVAACYTKEEVITAPESAVGGPEPVVMEPVVAELAKAEPTEAEPVLAEPEAVAPEPASTEAVEAQPAEAEPVMAEQPEALPDPVQFDDKAFQALEDRSIPEQVVAETEPGQNQDSLPEADQSADSGSQEPEKEQDCSVPEVTPQDESEIPEADSMPSPEEPTAETATPEDPRTNVQDLADLGIYEDDPAAQQQAPTGGESKENPDLSELGVYDDPEADQAPESSKSPEAETPEVETAPQGLPPPKEPEMGGVDIEDDSLLYEPVPPISHSHKEEPVDTDSIDGMDPEIQGEAQIPSTDTPLVQPEVKGQEELGAFSLVDGPSETSPAHTTEVAATNPFVGVGEAEVGSEEAPPPAIDDGQAVDIPEPSPIPAVQDPQQPQDRDSLERDDLDSFDPLKEWGQPMGLPAPADPKKDAKTRKPAAGADRKPTSTAARTAGRGSPAPAARKATDNKKSETNAKAGSKPSSAGSRTPRPAANQRDDKKPDAANKKPAAAAASAARKTAAGRPSTGGAAATPRDAKTTARSGPAGKRPATTSATGRAPAAKAEKPLAPVTPYYVDLTYVPCHGESGYADMEFFRKVRARYYVISSLNPNPALLDSLLDAKKTWENNDLEVTVIPTYDTDVLRHWMGLKRDALSELKIDVAPSANRCTIQLQDHETSCAAYRLEF